MAQNRLEFFLKNEPKTLDELKEAHALCLAFVNEKKALFEQDPLHMTQATLLRFSFVAVLLAETHAVLEVLNEVSEEPEVPGKVFAQILHAERAAIAEYQRPPQHQLH